MNIDNLLSNHNADTYYRFHGAGDFLSELVAQAEDGAIRLWGRTHDDSVDAEVENEPVQGAGYLYCTELRDVEVVFSNFSGSDNLSLVLEPVVENPQEWSPRSGDRRERLIRVEEWRVIGAVRPAYDEDGDCIGVADEAYSLEELLEAF